MHSPRPRIGITMDWQEKGTFSARPHYALREHYFHAVYAAGGLPVGIPVMPEALDDFIAAMDAILVPGGGYAMPLNWYEASDEEQYYPPSPRCEFDIAVIEKTLAADKPLLGICAGMQTLGGVLGAKVYKNVHTAITTTIDHMNAKPTEQEAHAVSIKTNTLLADIIGDGDIQVNTAHTEALSRVPNEITVNATAPDGVIEGIELADRKFVLGVQWHPEYFMEENNPHRKIIERFVEVARG